MIDIVIKGSCVTREAFNYQTQVYDKVLFKVSNYIFQKPIAVLESPQIINIEQQVINKLKLALFNAESVKDFVIKQVDKSFTKEFFPENDSDEKYFIMDFIDERMKLIKLNNSNSFIEYRKEFLKVLENENISFEIIKNSKDIFIKYIDLYIKNIKKNYREENIILNKSYAVCTTSIDGIKYPLTSTFRDSMDKRTFASYSYKRAIESNLFLMDLYDYIEKNYPSIKILELPFEKYFSPASHKYGRGYYHYNDEFYYDFLEELKELVLNKKAQINTDVAENNREIILRLHHMQKIMNNMYETNSSIIFRRNPEELFLGSLDTPISYKLSMNGKQLVKSYVLKNSKNGIMIYSHDGSFKGKFLFNTEHEIDQVYTLYPDGNTESFTTVGKDGEWYSNMYDSLKNDITNQARIENSNEGTDSIYSLFNESNEIILKIICSNNSTRIRFIFFEEKRINRVIVFEENKISQVMAYNNLGRMVEEFIMGDYIQIGKVQTKFRFYKGKKHVRYMYYASGNLQSKSLYNDNGSYFKTEYFELDGTIKKEVFYHNGQKAKTIDYLSAEKTKVSEYFETGSRKSISFFDNDEVLKCTSREKETDLLTI